MKPKIIIVNENDEQIGFKERGTLEKEDIYRVSALIVFNTQGKFLMAQRSFSKKNSPGLWNTSVAGTNDEGETYLSNILKEAHEEIGISIQEGDIRKLFKIRNNFSHNYFCTRYGITLDKKEEDFVLQEDEVEAVQFLSLDELEENLEREPELYSQNFYNIITTYLENEKE